LRQSFKKTEALSFPALAASDGGPGQPVENVAQIVRAEPVQAATRIELSEISHTFTTPDGGSVYAVDRINLSVPERVVRKHHRSVRLREDDAVQYHCRTRDPDGR
jgi:hypothetical protein